MGTGFQFFSIIWTRTQGRECGLRSYPGRLNIALSLHHNTGSGGITHGGQGYELIISIKSFSLLQYNLVFGKLFACRQNVQQIGIGCEKFFEPFAGFFTVTLAGRIRVCYHFPKVNTQTSGGKRCPCLTPDYVCKTQFGHSPVPKELYHNHHPMC